MIQGTTNKTIIKTVINSSAYNGLNSVKYRAVLTGTHFGTQGSTFSIAYN